MTTSFEEGQLIGIPCKVVPGALPHEVMVIIETMTGEVSGYVKRDELTRLEDDHGYLRARIVDISKDTVSVLLNSDSDTPGERIVLSLSDLLPDPNGDIVLSSATGPMVVNITTDQKVVTTGTADHHVTSDGVDVSGYHFCTLEAGVTIYYPAEIDLVVTLHVRAA